MKRKINLLGLLQTYRSFHYTIFLKHVIFKYFYKIFYKYTIYIIHIQKLT